MKTRIFFATALLFLLAGCGGGGENGTVAGTSEDAVETATEYTTNDTQEFLTVATTAINEVLSGYPPSGSIGIKVLTVDGEEKSSKVVDCTHEGTATADGTFNTGNPGDYNLTITLSNCEVVGGTINGTISAVGTYTIPSSGVYDAVAALTGTLSTTNCEIEFAAGVNIDVQLQGTNRTGTISGTLSATCDETAVTYTCTDADISNLSENCSGSAS